MRLERVKSPQDGGEVFRTGAVGIGVGLMFTGMGVPATGQLPVVGPACHDTVFRGRVTRGRSFEASLGRGLAFRLDAETVASNPPGWTIRVVPFGEPSHDYAMVATPPYRFWNPRHLDASYGVSAEQSLSMTPREFSFVATAEDFETAMGALDLLLWPDTHSNEEIQAAASRLEALPTYPGSLDVTGGEAAPPDSLNPNGAIEWLSFEVRLCIPGRPKGQ